MSLIVLLPDVFAFIGWLMLLVGLWMYDLRLAIAVCGAMLFIVGVSAAILRRVED